MQPVARAGLWGNVSLLTVTYGDIGVEANRTAIVPLMRDASGETTMIPTI
jgi:hypothetical protein